MANYKHNQKVWLISEKREATIIAIKTNYPSKTTTYVLENGKEVSNNELRELKPKKSQVSYEETEKTIEKLTKKRSGKNSDKSKSDK